MAEPTSGLAHYRQRKQLSQAQFARAIGVPQEYVSRMETGDMVPRAAVLDKMCEVLEVQPQLLFSKHILAEVAERARA